MSVMDWEQGNFRACCKIVKASWLADRVSAGARY